MSKKLHSLSPTLLAPFGDAIKLILTGSTSESLSAEQKAIYLNMLDQGMRDESGNKSKERVLPSIQTEQYCVDEKNCKYETMYFIPDIFRFMLTLFKDWSVFNPPVNLDYLNSIGFMYSNAPAHKEWEQSSMGKEHWDLICLKIETEREINVLGKTHHGNDPLKLEAQKRMRKKLDKKIKEINKKIESIEHPEKNKKNKANLVVDPDKFDWKFYARELGVKIFNENSRLSIEQISKKIHKIFLNEKITGRGDRVPSAETIKRHALSKIKAVK